MGVVCSIYCQPLYLDHEISKSQCTHSSDLASTQALIMYPEAFFLLICTYLKLVTNLGHLEYFKIIIYYPALFGRRPDLLKL
uniref:Uncharacterized protein n=1 Tax=Trichogramma kaykai TaxID=54128 RepID=A0ABD2W465_9HYME